ncbi:MAG: hypothetical protein K8R23_19150 [Chthoniobacter sp.]|nr:hypothetical protein [Chthoniobacter sp.]
MKILSLILATATLSFASCASAPKKSECCAEKSGKCCEKGKTKACPSHDTHCAKKKSA